MESNQKHFSTLLFNSPSGSFLTDSEIQSAGFQRNSMSSQRKIFISDTQMKSNTFSKHILYLISGEDLNGKFTNFRRYKDFIRLHKRLINQWPGCFIPHLPPKKAIGNLQMNFIETRKKLLENFLKELKNLEYLHYSEEMQEFLRGPPNFYQSERIEKSVNFNVIAEKYRELFSEFEGISRNAEVEKEISGLLGELNIGLRNFERIYLQCEENFSVIKEMQWKMCRFKEIVGEIKDFYGDPQEENISKESISNPYAELADWCRGNFLNVSGLIDCIYQQYELQRQKNALIEKIGEKQLEIQKLLKGKKTMAQYFYKKPKEFYIGKTETEISQMKENVTSINCILNFSSALVLKQYYPLFKYQKKEEFNSLVGATNGKHLKIFLVFSDYFKDI